MTISKIVDYIFPYLGTNIPNIILQYYGVFFLADKECTIIYDYKTESYKLYDINAHKIGIILEDGNILNPDSYKFILEHSLYDGTGKKQLIIENKAPSRFLRRSYLFNHILFLRNKIENYNFISWINYGEEFDIVYDNYKLCHYVIKADKFQCISPSSELYTIFPTNSYLFNLCNDKKDYAPLVVFYDKKNDVVLNKEKTHVAILLSMGWNAPKWSLSCVQHSLFDVSKVLQILPNNKLDSQQIKLYDPRSPIRCLCLHWIPINTEFIIYYTFDKGENYKLKSELRFKA